MEASALNPQVQVGQWRLGLSVIGTAALTALSPAVTNTLIAAKGINDCPDYRDGDPPRTTILLIAIIGKCNSETKQSKPQLWAPRLLHASNGKEWI